ncbi:MAG TPA: Lrp/AsnC family transcriptional regulator [Nitrosopumilaceae archaeon]|nr:Lrp/AsnC family transcriptional regulator [Nitrosopumilaceae archaeon]
MRDDQVLPTAFVLIRCEEGAEGKIMSKLNRKDTIREIQPTVGHYDFIAKVTSPDMEDLDKVIGEIRHNDKVRLTNVLRLNELVEAA